MKRDRRRFLVVWWRGNLEWTEVKLADCQFHIEGNRASATLWAQSNLDNQGIRWAVMEGEVG